MLQKLLASFFISLTFFTLTVFTTYAAQAKNVNPAQTENIQISAIPGATNGVVSLQQFVADDSSVDYFAGRKVTLGPGSPIYIAPSGKLRGGACTLGAIGYDQWNNLVGLTAGHCGRLMQAVYKETHRGAGVLGRFAVSVFIDSPQRFLDFSVIVFDKNRVTPVRTVGRTTVLGIADTPPIGNIVCLNGRTTGYSCGLSWGRINVGGPRGYYTQICGHPGDSGGPILYGDKLVGLLSGQLTKFYKIPLPTCIVPGLHGPVIVMPLQDIIPVLREGNFIGRGFRTV